jgi:hypothetical protein
MATKITGKQIDLTSFDTNDVSEGSSNLYYTDTRVRGAVSAGGDLTFNTGSGLFSVTTYKTADFNTDFGNKDSDDLTEGSSNLYYTEARFNTSFGLKSTTDLSEGSNLYYTDARVSTTLAGLSTQTIGASGSTITFSEDVVISGDLTISGTQTVVLSNDVNIGDAVITLNSDLAAESSPTEDGGFIVNRGSSANAQILWDETNDGWSFGLAGNMEPFLTMGDFSGGDGITFNSETGAISVSDGGIDSDMLKQTTNSEAVVAQAIRSNAIIADKIKIESVGGPIVSADVSAGYVDFDDVSDPTIYADSNFIVSPEHSLTAVYLNGLKLNLDPNTGTALGTGVDATIGQQSGKLRLYIDTNLISNGDSIEVILMFNN